MLQTLQHPCAQQSTDFRSGEKFCNGTWCFASVFFSLKENWLRICILCSLPCDLVAGIAVSSRTMLQFCGMGNHLWQNWPQGMHLHMRSATDRRYACIEVDQHFLRGEKQIRTPLVQGFVCNSWFLQNWKTGSNECGPRGNSGEGAMGHACSRPWRLGAQRAP
jgi:hypothetical protein